ncbi:MAG: hypothetical protein U9R37_04415 [Campylobacterota bacterium]|nr:hypothetical protein [Campylobacterota bacterium]
MGLLELSNGLDIEYFKERDELLSNSSDELNLYFIIKGMVQEKNKEEIVSTYSQNEHFDPISLIENRVKHKFIKSIETICYILPKHDAIMTSMIFLKLKKD